MSLKKSKKSNVFGRDGWQCLRCGTSKDLTIDHIVPKSLGGGNTIVNLQTLCRSCNNWKANRIISFLKAKKTRRYIAERVQYFEFFPSNKIVEGIFIGSYRRGI